MMQWEESQEGGTYKDIHAQGEEGLIGTATLEQFCGEQGEPRVPGGSPHSWAVPLGGTEGGRRCLAHTAQHPDVAELKSNPGFQPTFSELCFLAGWPRTDTQLRAE